MDNGSGDSGKNKVLHTQCSETNRLDVDDSDWLHKDGTYTRHVRSLEEVQNMSTSFGMHGQESFISGSACYEKKRQRDSSQQTRHRQRERYSLMTDEQREVKLQKSREYKKNSPGNQDRICPQ